MQRERESSKRAVLKNRRMHVNEGPILMQQEQANGMTVRDWARARRNPEIRGVSSAGLMAD